ncbi:DUF86 domain-containing protein [Thermus thermophilus]|uniref:HepT-like ribonuclease domain-containing protein n=1 Tax=Thermus thermophilus TaxID=274 RepID=UPI001FCC5304|nr:DUF86 domain-containing protein [Thermus thermophilus]BDG29867.1 DUF86 domain-containing protein [Thermus thermophilus]
MRRRRYTLFLRDILEAIRRIERFVGDRDFQAFAGDELLMSAVIRQLEIIGEAAKNLPEEVKGRHSQIPWSLMARMRDRLAHGYWTVDPEILWGVIQEELPSLKPRLAEILWWEEQREGNGP